MDMNGQKADESKAKVKIPDVMFKALEKVKFLKIQVGMKEFQLVFLSMDKLYSAMDE